MKKKRLSTLEKQLLKALYVLYDREYREIQAGRQELEDNYPNSTFSDDILTHDKEMQKIRALLERVKRR